MFVLLLKPDVYYIIAKYKSNKLSNPEKSEKTYPVVFIMNGQNISQFANEAATLDNLTGDRIPDMILIGISNTGAAGNYRSCPNDSGHVKVGKTFCTFIKDELIPEINKNYRTNGYQILAGQSISGLFVMYNFLFYPDVFNAYVIASPMFGWCPEFFLTKPDVFLKILHERYYTRRIQYSKFLSV